MSQPLDRLRQAFDEIVELGAEERERAIRGRAGGDSEMARELRALLAAADRTSSPLDTPLVQLTTAAGAPEGVPGYRLLAPIGHGGSSSVYLAEQTHEGFSRRVALKILHFGSDPAVRQRVREEQQILASLEHPGIARLYDTGFTPEGSPYLAMELVEGKTILDYCRDAAAPLHLRLEIFLAVLDAVDHAHRGLVVHRDLKPANILVSTASEVKLVDFGIARWLVAGSDAEATRTESRALTPAYASPEQVRGERLTTATDVYSLGAILYELVSGARPYRLDDTRWPTIEQAICGQEVERPRVGADLDAIILKALRKEPAARYASAAQFGEDIRRFLAGQPVLARRGTWRYRSAKFALRHRLGLAAAGALVVLAVSGLLVYFRDLARERDRANAAAAAALAEAAKAERVAELLGHVFRAANPIDQPGRPISALELLQLGSAQVEERLEGEPQVRGAMRSILAMLWVELGDVERAIPLAEGAVADLERTQGDASAATARAWHVLGAVRRRQGRNDEALDLMQRAIGIQELSAEAAPRPLAATLLGYGGLLRAMGRFDEAKAALERCVELYTRGVGAESEDVARAVGNLGLVLERLEDWEGAERAHERALAIFVREYGEDSPRTAITLGNLAGLWSRRGEPEKAIDALRRVMRIHERTLGADYPQSSVTQNLLGYALLDAKRNDEAAVEFERAVASGLKKDGERTTLAAWPMRGLAEIEIERGNFRGAADHYERARALRVKAVGPDHWEVAQSWRDLATVAEKQANPSLEERYRRAALAARRKAHPASAASTHPELARSAAELGLFLCRHGSGMEGNTLLGEALQLATSAKIAAEDTERWRAARQECPQAAS